jgi:hypothetical protein
MQLSASLVFVHNIASVLGKFIIIFLFIKYLLVLINVSKLHSKVVKRNIPIQC